LKSATGLPGSQATEDRMADVTQVDIDAMEAIYDGVAREPSSA
jgi:hypothetical protein